MNKSMPLVSKNTDKRTRRMPFWRGLSDSWLRFSGPNPRHFDASLKDQERLRHSRIISAFTFLMLISMLIVLPTAILVPIYWVPLSILGVMFVAAFCCNRAALVNLGGLAVIVSIDASLIILMLTLPTGIRNSNIPDFDLFLISILVAGIVLPRRVLLGLACFHLILIPALFMYLPHDPLLNQEIKVHEGGIIYGEFSDALLLQLIGTALAWLNARSVELALLRASKAKELEEVQNNVQAQALELFEQKERLEYGIDVLRETHARFANGDYHARAWLYNNELASLALSFNLLAERMNRVARAAEEKEQLDYALQDLVNLQEEVVYGKSLRPMPVTGTIVDKIYPWLKQYYRFRQVYSQCRVVLEKARFALIRQRGLLTQLRTTLDEAYLSAQMLDETRSSTPESNEKVLDLYEQIEDQRKRSLQEMKQLDEMLKVL